MLPIFFPFLSTSSLHRANNNTTTAHSPGLVPIRVYSNGKQISSNSMVFEYKADLRLNMVPVPPTDTSLKLCLIHRMECLEKCFRNFKVRKRKKNNTYFFIVFTFCVLYVCYYCLCFAFNVFSFSVK